MAAPRTLKEQLRRAVTRSIIDHAGFPMMPLSRRRFRRLMAKVDPPTAEIVEVVRDDYALLSRVLQVANSAAYGSETEVNQPSRAVVMIGRRPLVELVGQLPSPDSAPVVDPAGWLLGALLSAHYAEQLARRLEPRLKERAYVAGMFQPIGLHVLAHYAPGVFQQLFDEALRLEQPLEKVAPALLGSELGVFAEWAGRELRVPRSVLLGVRDPGRLSGPQRPSADEQVAALASLAGRLSARRTHPKLPEPIAAEVLLEHFYERFGDLRLDVEDLDRVVDAVISTQEAPLGLPHSGEELVALLQERARAAEPPEAASPGPVSSITARSVSTATHAASGVTQGILQQMEGMRARLGPQLVRRVVFLLRVRGEETLSFRVGVGEGLEGAEGWFKIPLREASIFTEALARPRQTSCSARPSRFPKALAAHAPRSGGLALSPVHVQGRPVGLFYLEGQGTPGQLRDASRELSWLKQAVEAQLNGAV